jgi:hypothetical protein
MNQDGESVDWFVALKYPTRVDEDGINDFKLNKEI